MFNADEGKILCSDNSGMRCSDAVFTADGRGVYWRKRVNQRKRMDFLILGKGARI